MFSWARKRSDSLAERERRKSLTSLKKVARRSSGQLKLEIMTVERTGFTGAEKLVHAGDTVTGLRSTMTLLDLDTARAKEAQAAAARAPRVSIPPPPPGGTPELIRRQPMGGRTTAVLAATTTTATTNGIDVGSSSGDGGSGISARTAAASAAAAFAAAEATPIGGAVSAAAAAAAAASSSYPSSLDNTLLNSNSYSNNSDSHSSSSDSNSNGNNNNNNNTNYSHVDVIVGGDSGGDIGSGGGKGTQGGYEDNNVAATAATATATATSSSPPLSLSRPVSSGGVWLDKASVAEAVEGLPPSFEYGYDDKSGRNSAFLALVKAMVEVTREQEQQQQQQQQQQQDPALEQTMEDELQHSKAGVGNRSSVSSLRELLASLPSDMVRQLSEASAGERSTFYGFDEAEALDASGRENAKRMNREASDLSADLGFSRQSSQLSASFGFDGLWGESSSGSESEGEGPGSEFEGEELGFGEPLGWEADV